MSGVKDPGQEDLLRLVDTLYAAAVDPPKWQTFCDDLARTLDGAHVALVLWVRPQEDVGTGGGIVLHRDPRCQQALHAMVPLAKGERMQAPTMTLLNALAPYLQRALQITQRLGGEQVAHRFMQETVEHMPDAVVLLDRSGRIAVANAAARGLVGQSRHLRLDPQRRLRCADPRADGMLAQAVRACATGNHDLLPAAFFIRGTGDRDGALVARAAPFLPGEEGADVRDGLDADPCMILTLVDTARRPKSVSGILSALYGLSGAEAGLAEALAAGESLNEYAERNGVSRHTVRNQLRAVYDKTGLNRQAALATLIQRLAVD